MITYCPACHTHFRVHAEQLAARAGQVRCGKCSQVFDALEHLIEEIAPARAPRPNPEFDAVRADAADAEHAPESATSKAPDIGATAQARVIAQAADVVAKAPTAGAETPAAPNDATARARLIAQAADVVTKAPAPRTETLAAPVAEQAIVGQVNARPVAASGASAFGFGPGAVAEPATPARRWPWFLGALLLLLILLAQAAYYYRSAVTVLFPEIKPYAVALCATLGCDVPLPRYIEHMRIEATEVQAHPTNPSVIVLSATLKNRAIFNQQYPLLDLTLTDALDQPVVRRVLAPQDYLGKAVNVEAGFAADSEIEIKVYIESSQVKATGYRLDRFYP